MLLNIKNETIIGKYKVSVLLGYATDFKRCLLLKSEFPVLFFIIIIVFFLYCVFYKHMYGAECLAVVGVRFSVSKGLSYLNKG